MGSSQQLQMSFELDAQFVHWQERADLYAGLSDASAWELHLQEVRQRFAFGSAPERELLYVQRRCDEAHGVQSVSG